MPTRRTVLTAAVLAGALAACTPEDNGPDSSSRQLEPDEAATAMALLWEQSLVGQIDWLTRGDAGRKRVLAPTRAIHVAHIDLLAPPAPEGNLTGELHVTPRPRFKGDDRTAYLRLARAEDELGETLRRAAFDAESGPLARVLAGMAAAAAQQSVALRGRL